MGVRPQKFVRGLIAARTFGSPLALHSHPQGIFARQDTGVIQAIRRRPQSVSYAAWAERQAAIAMRHSQGRRSDRMSSFIGVDGPTPRQTSVPPADQS